MRTKGAILKLMDAVRQYDTKSGNMDCVNPLLRVDRGKDI